MKAFLKSHPALIWWQGLSALCLVASFALALLQPLTGAPALAPLACFTVSLVLWLIGSHSALVLVRRREGVAEFLGVKRIKEGDRPREVFSLGDGVRLMHWSVLFTGVLYLLPLGGGLVLTDADSVLRQYANDLGFRAGSLAVASTTMICLWLLQLQLMARVESWYAEVKDIVPLPELSPLDAARVALV